MKECLVEGNLENLFQEPPCIKKDSRLNRVLQIFNTRKARPSFPRFKLPQEIEESGLVEPWIKGGDFK